MSLCDILGDLFDCLCDDDNGGELPDTGGELPDEEGSIVFTKDVTINIENNTTLTSTVDYTYTSAVTLAEIPEFEYNLASMTGDAEAFGDDTYVDVQFSVLTTEGSSSVAVTALAITGAESAEAAEV